MKTLHLNLKKEWFNMILSGVKTEEYRDVSNYWVKRLTRATDEDVFVNDVKYYLLGGEDDHFRNDNFEFKSFDTITFSNGYSKDRPQFEIELKGIKVDQGYAAWGAAPNNKYFVLELGKIINN